MQKQLLVTLLAGAFAGCGSSGTRSATSTGTGGDGGSPGGGGVAPGDLAAPASSDGGIGVAPGDLAAPGSSDGGVATPGVDAGLPPMDAGSGPPGDGGGTGGNDAGGNDAGLPCPMTPITLGTSSRPGPIATNSKYVYWLDSAPPETIWRVPQAGGAAELVATDTYGTTSTVHMVADDNGVYWGSTTYPPGNSVGVSRIFALRPNGTVDTLASGAYVDALVLSGSTLFFADRFGTYAVSTTGGGEQTLVTSFSGLLVSLAVNPSYLFVQENGLITRIDRTTGVSDVLGSFYYGVALAVDSERAYSLKYDGVVYAFPPSDGVQLSPANDSGLGGQFITIDGTHLYYGSPNGDLSRIATDGSGYTELAPAANAAVISGNRIIYSHDSEVSVLCK